VRRRGWIALAVVVVVAGAAAIGVAGSRLVGRRTPAEARSPATAAAGSGPASATTMSSTRCTPTMGQPVRGWDGPTHGPPRLRLGPGLALRPTAGTLAASRRGRLMVVSGRVLTSGCAAVPGAAVRVWQTNGDGDYGPGQGTGQIRCCYLQGTMTTDAHGRFEFESVRPGNYSGTPHVHLVIRAPDGRGLETEVEFADDPGAAAGGGPVLHLADRGSRLHGSLDVVLG
jgi:protocatechuate 3,4-dioxygenase beta subunit